ncbi:MAG: S-adenosylmethionine decarboxylase, partial [Planctomycetes bacterium]|nr:S-adenosylmethionine decarboxylase [Planctomycetota bacterium]
LTDAVPKHHYSVVVLDESHVSAHTYADRGLIALDVFTCGSTDPADVLSYLRDIIDLGDVSIREVPRFTEEPFRAQTVPELAAC